MSKASKHASIFELSHEIAEIYDDIIFDRDGVVGSSRYPIEPERAKHMNRLIEDIPETRFTSMTNGRGEIEPIEAVLIRTWPIIKQFRPGYIRNYVEDPRRTLFTTDSLSESTMARALGFDVFYVQDEDLAPNRYEDLLRIATQPIRPRLEKLVLGTIN